MAKITSFISPKYKMTLEIEAKIKVESLESIAQHLDRLGAHFVAEQVQSDAYFFDAAGRLAKSGCGLRLRTETVDGKTVSILTFKGPRQPGPYKTRPEYETAVNDAEAMVHILEGLGYCSGLTVAKKRCLWEWQNCQVCLDTVPPLGCFVEVEGPDNAAINNVLTRLKLADRPHITEGYAAMMIHRQNYSHSP
jgi:predicted adenylyl cyclase CyaB